ncbi:MAG: hypothetical protein K2X27_01825, partial [Candidatus Obscuribacterales bacterium]|nr:hypothetical protein [Candidatus Obscuribacterales bacterium]
SCNHVKATCTDILNEGRNSPARKKWLDFYLSSLQDDMNSLKSASAAISSPAEASSSMPASWKDTHAAIQSLTELVASLALPVQAAKSPTDDTYPPRFWKPASELALAADKLDASLMSIFSVLDASLDQSSPDTLAQINSLASAPNASAAALQGHATAIAADTGVKQLADASKKVSKACYGLFGELERWNLLYGKPPAGGIGDMLYGGGLTQQEIYSQYKYLPQFTFTNAPYVMLYSYRLPPRQNMLAYHTAEIGKVLNLMESDLNEMQIPADRKLAMSGPLEDSKKLFLDARNKYLALLNLVNNTSDARLQQNIREDQVTIGEPVMAIYSDMSKMRDALLDIGKILK